MPQSSSTNRDEMTRVITYLAHFQQSSLFACKCIIDDRIENGWHRNDATRLYKIFSIFHARMSSNNNNTIINDMLWPPTVHRNISLLVCQAETSTGDKLFWIWCYRIGVLCGKWVDILVPWFSCDYGHFCKCISWYFFTVWWQFSSRTREDKPDIAASAIWPNSCCVATEEHVWCHLNTTTTTTTTLRSLAGRQHERVLWPQGRDIHMFPYSSAVH